MAGDRKRLLLEVLALLVVVALIVTFMTRRRGEGPSTEHRLMMGTLVSITVLDPPGDDAKRAIDVAFEQIARIEARTTRYSDDSEISRLNARVMGYEEELVFREVAETVIRSLAVAEASGGAFDPTIAPLVNLWKLTDKRFVPPGGAALQAALRSVDWRAVRVDSAGRTMTVPRGTQLDLDGVVKGYAVDRALAILEGRGVRAAIVDAGGDIGFIGQPPDEGGWRVGVKHPRQEGLLGVLTLDGRSVATSGDYQRYAIFDGERYHHVLNPHTGYPARGVMSVTVAAELAVDADALATAVFVLGPDEGMALVESMPGVDALIVTGDGDDVGTVLLSSGFEGKFTLE